MAERWTTPEALAELKRLHEAATVAPWKPGWTDGAAARRVLRFEGPPDALYVPCWENEDLMCAARNALPQLIAEIERLRKEAEEAENEMIGPR